jgi:hypothetical protein
LDSTIEIQSHLLLFGAIVDGDVLARPMGVVRVLKILAEHEFQFSSAGIEK